MQQGVASDVSVKVILLVSEDPDVGAEDKGRVESFQTEVDEVDLGELADDPQGKTQDQNEGRVNSFYSSTVKVEERKLFFECLLYDNLSDQKARDDKERVNANKTSS